MLKERWFSLSDADRKIWKGWERWDAKRYAHQMMIYSQSQDRTDADESNKSEGTDALTTMHVPKKRKASAAESSVSSFSPIPKKSR